MGNLRYPFHITKKTDNDIQLLYVTSSKYEGDWPSYIHSHHFTELFYVKSGSGEFQVDQHSIPIKKDNLIIVNPNIPHTEISSREDPLTYITLGVEGMIFSFPNNNGYTIIPCSQQKSNLLFYFGTMLTELETQKEGYQDVCVSLLNILTILLKRLTLSPCHVVTDIPSNQSCAKIKRYIDNNYQDNITLDSLASMAHLNKYYFTHIFTETYGSSPINYLNERRIQVSMDLLVNSDYNIAEIATLSGFSSQSYFAQSFKKVCHMSASTFRKINQKKRS